MIIRNTGHAPQEVLLLEVTGVANKLRTMAVPAEHSFNRHGRECSWLEKAKATGWDFAAARV